MKYLLASSLLTMLAVLPSASADGLRGLHRELNADDAYNQGPIVRVGGTKPYAMCQGNCLNDGDCQAGLVCERTRFRGTPSPVSGCSISPNDISGTDFCVNPALLTPVDNSFYNQGPPVRLGTSKPFGVCEGNCLSNDDCQPGLLCDLSRRRGDPGPVPGCAISPFDLSGTDYCVLPVDVKREQSANAVDGDTTTDSEGEELNFDDTSGGPLVFVGENPNTSDPDKKLGLCEGDCDSDYDCAQGLMCWQRNRLDNIPGCEAGGRNNKDYCVYEKYRGTDGDQFFFPASETFRLKLYWQEGYKWQEESFERRWCIECIDRSCNVGELVYISECSIARNDILEFVAIDSTYFQIKEAEDDKCFQRFGNAISWQICDENELDQHFRAADMEGNTLDTKVAEKFELRPRRNLVGDGIKCITQRHHPKDSEWLDLEDCDNVRKNSDTSLWEKY